MSGIYDEPELYELACSYRDVPAEATALLAWCAGHFRGPAADGEVAAGAPDGGGAFGSGAAASGAAGAGAPAGPWAPAVRSVLELAAGPAEHARELARRGLRAAVLDRSPAMCGYAAAQAKAAGVDLAVVEGDMRDFRITAPDGSQARFDLVITMLNSLCHLFTLDDLVRHLSAVTAHLANGGIYIVELAHPADFFGRPRTSSEWTIDSDGVHAEVRWGGRADRIDPLTQVTEEHMTITATAADGTIRTVSDVVPNRFWTLTEFDAARRLAGGIELVATYGDFDQTTPLDAPTAWRMILVLRHHSADYTV